VSDASGLADVAHDVLLADGGSARIRPVRADDAPRIAAFHRALSLETVEFRYFTGLRTLPPLLLKRFSQPDPERDLVLVAEIGDALIALASAHRKPGEDTAEVAFVVADAQQGRGLGTLLLEELAARARSRGIAYFRADTLTRNRAMLRVFHDAGFDVERVPDSTVVHLHFPIRDTPRAQAAHERREHHAEARSLLRLVAPKSLLLAGGRAEDFPGPVYTDLRGLPPGVDLALYDGEAAALGAFVHACGDAGVHALAVGELRGEPEGNARADFDRELRMTARAHGMRLLGPGSLGILNTADGAGLRALPLAELPGPGPIGVASESRERGAALLAGFARKKLGVSTFVSLGRRADVSVNDCLSYWLEDGSTQRVVLELESCGNPLKFERMAAAFAEAKPLYALATGDAAQDAALTRAGAAVHPTLDALLASLPRALSA
jgi:GNAT superfamily N-acetyltransferase